MKENENRRLTVKLIHCGNRNIANPEDNLEKYVFYMPMGIFALAGHLRENGFAVQIIHLDLEKALHIDEIIDFASLDAVGFDCHWANQSRVVLHIAQLIKQKKPGAFIFLGGYTAGFFAREILSEYAFIDAVIRGDAEIPIVGLCRALERNRLNNEGPFNQEVCSLEEVPNLAWKNGQEIHLNTLTYVASVEEMNRFDFTAVDLLKNWESYRDLSKYWTKFAPINSYPMFLVEIGRGCPYGCTYCGGNNSAQFLINGRKGQVIRSIDVVIASIEKGISFGYSCFFACFEFTGSDDWYIELFTRLKARDILISFAYESWSIPSKRLIDVMSECCRQVIYTISPDSANEQLRKTNKDKRLFYSNAELEDCLQHIGTKNNVKMQVYFGYFIPFETAEHVYETMDFITKLYYKYGQCTEIVYMNFNTDPGSSLFINPGEYDFNLSVRHFKDFVRKLEINYQTDRGKRPGMTLLSHPAGLTPPEAVHLANKINIFNNLFCFEKSILELVEKTGKTSILADYFRDVNLAPAAEKHLSPAAIKELLLEICRYHFPVDVDTTDNPISVLIEEEFKHIPYKSLVKNLTHYYTLDAEVPETIPEDKKMEILSGIKNRKGKTAIDFDLE